MRLDVDNLVSLADQPHHERLDLARRIIERFDVDFDALDRREAAIGALTVLRAGIDEAEAGPEALAVLAGEAWCRIIDSDVRYDLQQGWEIIERSRGLVERLVARPPVGEPWSSFAAYAVARWNDGAGKINFRLGDMWTAGRCFDEAAKGAADRCYFDVASNRLRAEHDADAQVGEQGKRGPLAGRLEALLQQAIEAWTASGGLPLEDLARAVAGEAGRFWSVEDGALEFPRQPHPMMEEQPRRERLRGLANIEHNLSVALRQNRDESEAHSRRSALYSYAMADGYRFAQALRHLCDLRPPADPVREAICRRLLRLPWQRGRIMARQIQASWLKNSGRSVEARGLLEELLGRIQEQQRDRGGDSGVDVDLLSYTAQLYREAGADEDSAARWGLTAARSLRRAVKTTLYRRRFKDSVLPAYQREIARRTSHIEALGAAPDPEEIETLLALVEETTARELLDLLATRGGNDTGEPTAEAELPPSPRRPDMAIERGGLRAREAGGDDGGLSDCLQRDRGRFETQLLQRAVASAEIDADVGQSLRRLTAAPGGPTIVRYFGTPTDNGRDTRLHAVVIRAGKVSPVTRLAGDDGQELTLGGLARIRSGTLPTMADARWLWERLLAPLWSEVLPAPEEGLAQLVIIPAPGMFALPLHVALVPRQEWPAGLDPAPPQVEAAPLAVVTPLSFTVSATAFVTRQRYLLRTQPFDPGDDLCALVPDYLDPERRFVAGELAGLDWRPERFHLAGRDVEGAPRGRIQPGTVEGLGEILKQRAEVFVFAGHGNATRIDRDSEVALELDEHPQEGRHFLSQYGLLSSVGLGHNKWTLLNACVSGTASDEASRAEVSGFLKAFIAAGAGALTVTLWPVRNDDIVAVAGKLLAAAAEATRTRGTVDIVERLRQIQCDVFSGALSERDSAWRFSRPAPQESAAPSERSLHACPMVLYL